MEYQYNGMWSRLALQLLATIADDAAAGPAPLLPPQPLSPPSPHHASSTRSWGQFPPTCPHPTPTPIRTWRLSPSPCFDWPHKLKLKHFIGQPWKAALPKTYNKHTHRHERKWNEMKACRKNNDLDIRYAVRAISVFLSCTRVYWYSRSYLKWCSLICSVGTYVYIYVLVHAYIHMNTHAYIHRYAYTQVTYRDMYTYEGIYIYSML